MKRKLLQAGFVITLLFVFADVQMLCINEENRIIYFLGAVFYILLAKVIWNIFESNRVTIKTLEEMLNYFPRMISISCRKDEADMLIDDIIDVGEKLLKDDLFSKKQKKRIHQIMVEALKAEKRSQSI